MHGVPTDFWGKLKHDDQNNVVGWHALADHCADAVAPILPGTGRSSSPVTTGVRVRRAPIGRLAAQLPE